MQFDGQPLFEDKKELEDANKVKFDFLILLDRDNESSSNKKRVCIYKKDNITIIFFKNTDYFNLKEDNMNLLLVESTWGSVKLLACV